MKREFLEAIEVNGVKLTKEAIDSIMAENGKDIEGIKTQLSAKEQELATKTTEAEGYKTQLSERDKDIKELKAQAGNSEELNTKLTELQTKYDTDTSNLKKQLDDQSTDHAMEKFFGGYEFASELAKKAAMADFKAKQFKIDEKGNFAGGKEFMEDLKKTDPAAFKPAEDTNKNPPLPSFAGPTGTGSGSGGDNKNPFNFGFSAIRNNEKK